MSNADDIFWRRFGMILAAMTLFGFVVAFLARSIAGDAHQISMNKPEAVAARIAPMGEARVGDPGKVVAATPKAAAATETTKEAPAGTAATEAPKEATASAASAPAAGKPGKEVYAMGCVACHATGAANAPKLDDKAAWEPRAATGFAALMSSVTKGKGAMPPRGGLASLSDADVENAVRYMLKEAGVEAGG